MLASHPGNTRGTGQWNVEVEIPGTWLSGSETEGAVARVDSARVKVLLLEDGFGHFLNKGMCWKEGGQQEQSGKALVGADSGELRKQKRKMRN